MRTCIHDTEQLLSSYSHSKVTTGSLPLTVGYIQNSYYGDKLLYIQAIQT